MIILRGVNVFPTQIEEQVLTVDGLAPYYQIELSKDGRMDAMRVLVESLPGAADGEAQAVQAATLSHRIKEVVGVTAKITVADPGTVERSEGKARRVIDNRPKG